MKKIILLLGIAISLLTANNESKRVNGTVQNKSIYDDNTMLLIIRNYDTEIIRAEMKKNNIEINDKVTGNCSRYEASKWKNCYISAERKYEQKESNLTNIDGKIKHVSLLNDYNIIEVENNNDILQTINIRVNKNSYYKINESIYGFCQTKIKNEHSNCNLMKKIY